MKRPTLRGCAGALVAVALVAAAMTVPSSLGEMPGLPRIETFISMACGGASPCVSPERARWLKALDGILAERMPKLPERERGQLATVIYEEAKAASLDPFFVLAVIAAESGFDHVAESERGARGLMQLRPSTVRGLPGRAAVDDDDLDDPVLNVRAGVRYLRRLLRAFGSTDIALMAYNAGPNRILRYLQEEGAIPERFLVYPERVNGEFQRLRGREPAQARRGSVALAPAAPHVPDVAAPNEALRSEAR